MDVVTDLAQAIAAIVGSANVLTDPSDLRRYRGVAWNIPRPRIALKFPPAPPALVVRPRQTEDIAAILRLAQEHNVPVVPFGAGTGVMGGAMPVAGSVVLDLSALNRILEIRVEDRLARVQAGVILEDLETAAQRVGLMVGHDPWSRPIATVGGAVSTNGVGYLAGKYGPMGAQVLGLEAVMADGTVMRTRAVPRPAGPDLKALLIGAEGTLGVITEVAVRLFPQPERRIIRAYRFRGFRHGFEAICALVACGLQPALLDFEEEETTPIPTATLYLGFEGPVEETEAAARRADQMLRAAGALDLGDQVAREFWDTRHESAYRYLNWAASRSPDGWIQWTVARTRYLDVSLPVSAVLRFYDELQVRAPEWGIVARNASVWCLPEFFSVILEATRPDADLEAATDAVLRLAQALQGSMESCHGIGVRLAHLVAEEFGAGLMVLRRIKQALDPAGILNPGKLGL
jgi:FAD/FMN-containing dehydrogenase